MLNIRIVFMAAGLCLASAVHAAPAAAQSTITCESRNNRFKDCQIETGGRVRLEKDLSKVRCEYGRTWGFDWNSVWVDGGCRGRFGVNGSGSGWESGNFGQRRQVREPGRLLRGLQGTNIRICEADPATFAVTLPRGKDLGIPGGPDLGRERLWGGVRDRLWGCKLAG